MTTLTRRVPQLTALAVLALVTNLVLGGPARGDSGGRTMTVHGTASYRSTFDNCESPVGLCASGRYVGVLNGTVTNVALAIIPSLPAGMGFFQEDDVLTLPGGTLTTKVSAAASFVPNGEVASIHKVVGGTGAFAGATGFYSFLGFVDADGLGASGTYDGKIQLP